MPRGRPRKIKKVEEVQEETVDETEKNCKPTEKERLMALYEELKTLKVNSLGDLENLIAKAE